MAAFSGILRVGVGTVAFAAVTLGVAGQGEKTKPKVSDQPLSAEQVAVYRTVLAEWGGGEKLSVNLAALTYQQSDSDFGSDKACASKYGMEAPGSEVHRIRAEDVAMLGPEEIRLIDPDRGAADVKKNDPEKGMRVGMSVDDAVRNGFNHGLFSFSEIRFNKGHTRAMVAYSFVCGGLCGNGSTVVLEKQRDGGWKQVTICGGWIS
jgi:hypothetical protein